MRAACGDRRFLFRVVVDVEVLGREDLEVESLVLDLVATEVLGEAGNRAADKEQRRQHNRDR